MTSKPTCHLCDAEIIGTADLIPGTAMAYFTKADDGEVEVEYVGETKVHWDAQYVTSEEGQNLVVCDNHHTTPINTIRWIAE